MRRKQSQTPSWERPAQKVASTILFSFEKCVILDFNSVVRFYNTYQDECWMSQYNIFFCGIARNFKWYAQITQRYLTRDVTKMKWNENADFWFRFRNTQLFCRMLNHNPPYCETYCLARSSPISSSVCSERLDEVLQQNWLHVVGHQRCQLKWIFPKKKKNSFSENREKPWTTLCTVTTS